MANIAPQTPDLNRRRWKRLEDDTRRMAKTGRQLRIVVVPVWWQADTLWLHEHRIAVPHGFVKSIYDAADSTLLLQRYFCN